MRKRAKKGSFTGCDFAICTENRFKFCGNCQGGNFQIGQSKISKFALNLYLNDKSIVADMASRYEEYLSLAGTVIFTSWVAGIIRSRWINRGTVITGKRIADCFDGVEDKGKGM